MGSIFMWCCRRFRRGSSPDLLKSDVEDSGKKNGKGRRSRSKALDGHSKSSKAQKKKGTEGEEEEKIEDLSVVKRENDVLRSYQKPPPPKNRARASRAPRTLRSQESIPSVDIFQEVEEGTTAILENVPKENPKLDGNSASTSQPISDTDNTTVPSDSSPPEALTNLSRKVSTKTKDVTDEATEDVTSETAEEASGEVKETSGETKKEAAGETAEDASDKTTKEVTSESTQDAAGDSVIEVNVKAEDSTLDNDEETKDSSNNAVVEEIQEKLSNVDDKEEEEEEERAPTSPVQEERSEESAEESMQPISQESEGGHDVIDRSPKTPQTKDAASESMDADNGSSPAPELVNKDTEQTKDNTSFSSSSDDDGDDSGSSDDDVGGGGDDSGDEGEGVSSKEKVKEVPELHVDTSAILDSDVNTASADDHSKKISGRSVSLGSYPSASPRPTTDKEKRFPIPSVHGERMDQLLTTLQTRLKEDGISTSPDDKPSDEKETTRSEHSPKETGCSHSDSTQQQDKKEESLQQATDGQD